MSGTLYTPLGYCNEEDVQNFLMLDIDDSFSSQISTYIAAAEKWVNRYLGYTTASGLLAEQFTNVIEDTATVDSEGNLVIFPRKTPLISVQGISLVKGTDALNLTLTDSSGNAKYQIAQDTDSIVYPGVELAFTGSSVVQSFFDIRYTKFFAKLSYIAGFTQIPPDVHLATVNVTSDYIMRHANKEGLQSVTQGGVSKSWFQREAGESDFLKDARMLLDPYRLVQNWIKH